IFESINKTSMDSMSELRKAFQLLYNRLGRVPYLKDFKEQEMLDPVLLANKKKSYYDFLLSMGETEGLVTEEEQRYLMIASRELLSGMRKHELVLLKRLIDDQKNNVKKAVSTEELGQWYEKLGLISDNKTIQSVLNSLDLRFFTGMTRKTYGDNPFISIKKNEIKLSKGMKAALNNDYFKKLCLDIIETGLLNATGYLPEASITLYEKYKRKDVLRLLNWEEQLVDQNIGGYTAKNGEFVIFVTLEKGEDFAGSQMAYEDELLDSTTMKWFTKAPRTLKSPEVEKLKNPKDWIFRLFVKKSDDEGSDFYYLGEVTPVQETINELKKATKEGKKKNVVEMLLKLDDPIENSLFRYLTLKE
ncbi:MAG: DUF3427 domain-containing protein, partial [Alkalibacterium sp.]|uniref:DUF3427 domain-containing protein n=1 Tax=Alkalibacterium sp. TaxID=1872447 RepID=UPI003970C246